MTRNMPSESTAILPQIALHDALLRQNVSATDSGSLSIDSICRLLTNHKTHPANAKTLIIMLHQDAFRGGQSERLLTQSKGKKDWRARCENLVEETHQDALFELVNQERTKWGLPALVLSEELSDLARLQAVEMKNKNKVIPTTTCEQELRDMLDSRHVAEHVGRGVCTRAIHKSMLQQQQTLIGVRQKNKILSRTFREVGIGIAEGSGGTIFVCQLFRGRTGR